MFGKGMGLVNFHVKMPEPKILMTVAPQWPMALRSPAQTHNQRPTLPETITAKTIPKTKPTAP
ncbi:hypothetical protein HZ326_23461, partial [Fusarium oxysporum f. sp. albedinis]